MYRYVILTLHFILGILIGYAQSNQVSGKLIDAKSKKPLQSITVLLKNTDKKIISFKASNGEGEFTLLTTKHLEGAYLEINHLGYKKKRIDNVKSNQQVLIELEESTIVLEDVEVKSRPRIKQEGDTLSYNVSSFAKEEDRSIGDVLKRMPGIEVSESGQIKYQGKSISNFYLDGDDLLKQKYGIGTKTIAHNLIQDVQVLNNHEHMKVLKNKRYSDEVALNLVIKDEAKISISGQAKIGAGLPKQYDMETNTVLFNKKYKGLNVLQGNNIGNKLKGDLIGFNASGVLSRLGRSPINNLLGLGTGGNPPLNSAHYFMNNSVGINANNMVKLKEDWKLTSNMQGVYEKNSKDFAGVTTYLTDNGNIRFDESQHAKTKEWAGAFNLALANNMESLYFNNDFAFEYEEELASATIVSNTSTFDVNRSHLVQGFSNKLDYVPGLKNGDIIQFSWYLNYGVKPQSLHLTPGVFADLLNEEQAYTATRQNLEVPSWLTNLSFGYRLPNKKIGQYYSVNVTADKQNLQSFITTDNGNTLIDLENPATKNDMGWLRSSLSLQASYNYSYRKFSSQLTLPFAFQKTAYKDPLFQLDEELNKIMFSPAFSSRYNFNPENELAFNYQRSNSYGNIEDVYRGLIVRNYRLISNNTAGINESLSNNFALNYKTGKAVKLMFYNVGINYNQSISSTMLSNTIDKDNTQVILIAQENRVNNYGVSVGFDKYLFDIASTLKLNSSINWTDYNQIFNGDLLPFINTTYALSPNVETRLWKKLNLSYTGNVSWTTTRQVNDAIGLNQQTFNISQNLSFPITLFKGFHLRVSSRHLYSQQQAFRDINYLFMDTFVRYTYKKWKTDLELNVTNIGNIKKFDTYAINANMQSQNSYELRGRMAVLKAVFNFSKKSN
jgi:hypothetical protein